MPDKLNKICQFFRFLRILKKIFMNIVYDFNVKAGFKILFFLLSRVNDLITIIIVILRNDYLTLCF